MAYEIPGFKVGIFRANLDLSASQFRVVRVAAATGTTQGHGIGGAAILAASAGLPNLGILQNAPLANEAAEVMTTGISKAVAGAAIATIGGLLMATSTGKLIPATTGNNAVAMALETASGDGVFLSVMFGQYGIVA